MSGITQSEIGHIRMFLADNQKEMFSLLEKMVLIQTGSENKQGLDRLARLIGDWLTELGMDIVIHSQENLGDNLLASTNKAGEKNNILLIGHMDTVFPEYTDFNWYREDGEKAYGPGVADMKGGLVVGMFALAALAELGRLKELPLRFIFNSDEEIDSPGSRSLIMSEARKATLAFVLECGGPTGQVVTGRKGRLAFDIHIKGRAGHAAFAGVDKASAILELAHQVIALEEINDLNSGVTVNVGVMQGGIGLNSVPEHASASVDVRFTETEAVARFESELDKRINRTFIDGTSANINVTSRRPPMVQSPGNLELYQMVFKQADRIGKTLDHEFRSGGSDANLAALEGCPVIDGLGPIGGLDHSDKEYIIKSSLLDRALLLCLCLLECRPD